IFASDCNTIKSKDENIISTKLIYWFLKSIQKVIYTYKRGHAQPHVYADDIAKIKIPLPPKDVQKKIAAEIEALEEKETEAKDKIERLRGKIDNILETLKYDTIELGNIVSLKNGLNYSRKSSGDTINIIGVGDFQNNIVPNLDFIEQIQIEGELSEDYLLKPDDLLVVRSNGSAALVGRFLLIDKVLPKTSFSGFTIRLRPNLEKVHPKYLCYYLRTKNVREKLTRNSGGSNIKSLNQTLLFSLKVPLPPLPEQQKIAAEIEKLEDEIQGLQKLRKQTAGQKELCLRKYL
ncbi:MAG: restriction endonuclease subunit S, partial [Treponema sp.]|nr:restriction endonuclease subunit S [Treponema sp.]